MQMLNRIKEVDNMRKTKFIRLVLFCSLLVFVLAIPVCGAVTAPKQVTGVKVSYSGTTKQIVSWKKQSGVSGYQIYCSTDGRKYKRVVTQVGNNKSKYTVKSRKKGQLYLYLVRAFKKVDNNKVVYGPLSLPTHGFYSKNAPTNPSTKTKYAKVFGDSSLVMRYPGAYYTNAEAAKANMKTITVLTWDFVDGNSGPKKTRIWQLTVHQGIADAVQKVFKEIYEGEEKFPIHSLGAYEFRGGHTEHNTGTAIDINWEENCMMNTVTGQILAGYYWKPGEDPYSIPEDGEVAKIFNKYGFRQGSWSTSKDYMHFSYFGT